MTYDEKIFNEVIEEMGLKLNPNPNYDKEIENISKIFSVEYTNEHYNCLLQNE